MTSTISWHAFSLYGLTEKPFEEISDETFAEAMKLVDSCEKVIDAGVTVGKTNSRIAELIEKAKNDKKLEKR